MFCSPLRSRMFLVLIVTAVAFATMSGQDLAAQSGAMQQTSAAKQSEITASTATAGSSPASGSYIVYSVAGSGVGGYAGDNGNAAVSQLNTPSVLVRDGVGNLFIADTYNQVVRRVDALTGVITTVVGTGHPGYSGDGGPALKAQLNFPDGLAFDSLGNLYIAEENNSTIRKVNAITGLISTVAGPFRGIYSPAQIAIDAADNLYIVNGQECNVAKLNTKTGILANFAGTSGFCGFSDDGGLATKSELLYPQGIAVDSQGSVYIAESSSSRIRKVDATTKIITTIAGSSAHGYNGDGGPATDAELNFPTGLIFDAAGNLYVADLLNNCIREISAATGIITTVAGNALVTPAAGSGEGDGGPATSASFFQPKGLVVDGSGNMWIADTYHHRIRVVYHYSSSPSAITPRPASSRISGTYNSRPLFKLISRVPGAAIYYTLDGSVPTTSSAMYYQPITLQDTSTLQAIALTPGHVPSVLSEYQYTVDVKPADTMSTVAGNGLNTGGNSGDPATKIGIGAPEAVTIDQNGNFYFVDSFAGKVWEVDRTTGLATLVAGGGSGGDGSLAVSAGLNAPSGLALDSKHNLYIVEVNGGVTIRKVSHATGIISTVNGIEGPRALGQISPEIVTRPLYQPMSIGFDQEDNLYYSYPSSNVVYKLNTTTGANVVVAGNGKAGYTGDGGPATKAELNVPESVAVDKAGDVFLVDSFNYAIRRVDAETGIISTIAGNGDFGLSGEGGLASAAEVGRPVALTVNPNGDVFFTNYGWNLVYKVPAVNGILIRVAGNMNTTSGGDGGPATLAGLDDPYSVAVDAYGNIYIADTVNELVRKVTIKSTE